LGKENSASIENNNLGERRQNLTEVTKGYDSPKSNDYQLLNENMLNDEDEIKNEIQAIDNTVVNLNEGAEPKEQNSANDSEKDLNDYVMNEFPEKIKVENLNDHHNININETAERYNFKNSYEISGNTQNSNSNQPVNISHNQIQEDRNCKLIFISHIIKITIFTFCFDYYI